MNGREVYQAIYSGERFDRIPLCGIGAWAETLERWRMEGLGHDEDPNVAAGLVSDDSLSLRLNLNMHPLYDINIVSEDERHVTLIDEYGVTKQMMRADFENSHGMMGAAGATSGMSHWLDFPVKDLNSWREIFEARFNAIPEGRVLYESSDQIARTSTLAESRWVRHFSFPFGGFFSAVRQVMGLEGAVFAMADQPGLIHQIVSDLSDFYTEAMALIVPEIRLDMVTCFEDMCSNRAPLISPAMFDEFFAPGYRTYFGHLRDMGVREFFIDTDGDSRLLIPSFLKCGFTGVHPCEAKAGMDPAPILEQYPDLSCNCGIDKRAVAIGGTAMAEEIECKFRTAWVYGRYTPGLDHGFPPDISWQNAKDYASMFIDLSTSEPS